MPWVKNWKKQPVPSQEDAPSFDLSLRPLVRFTRFNRIVMRSLHVNANRYVNIFVFCFVYFAWGFSFDSDAKLQNFSDIGYVLQHDGLQAAYIGEQKDAI